ncbi:MAG: NYN domain-containing protein [Kineosporiaceae bacterium]
MDRFAIFIDAGYLLAEGGKAHVAPDAKRGDVSLDVASALDRLVTRAAACGLSPLRTYWYDGAVNGVPTSEQLAISDLPDLKLRLGRIVGGRQKGVDGLIYRDMTVLARERAICSAFLLAGDEDLREGVVTAQELGLHVTLWGVGREGNQSRSLMAEVDRHCQLDDLADLFHAAPGSRLALERQTAPATVVAAPEAVTEAARAFADEWRSRATAEELGELRLSRPLIPSGLDAELLRRVQSAVGDLRQHEGARRAAREEFWARVDPVTLPRH